MTGMSQQPRAQQDGGCLVSSRALPGWVPVHLREEVKVAIVFYACCPLPPLSGDRLPLPACRGGSATPRDTSQALIPNCCDDKG